MCCHGKTAVREQVEYLIGDVARMVGLSRDALRFYEKKGVISARKNPMDTGTIQRMIFISSCAFSITER